MCFRSPLRSLVACLWGWLFLAAGAAAADDPLPSWNEGANKTALIDFVTAVTSEGGPDYVPPADRIATFDNDGTLWGEQPMYVQLAFILDRVKEMAADHPDWQNTEPYKSVLTNDFSGLAAAGEQGLMELVATTHAGMNTEEFTKIATEFITTAKHPKTGKLYTQMVFQPMLEVVAYLKANEFDVFIVSGGGREFMRPWTGQVYGIPPQNVVGSEIEMRFEMKDGVPTIFRDPKIAFIDDGAGKPIGIQNHIGKKPIAAFGNSDGDIAMLQWATSGAGRRFAGIVHHDDAAREYAYDRTSHFGKLDKGLELAGDLGWHLFSVKNDWKQVYPQ